MNALSDIELKKKYDETFEGGHIVYGDLPLECSVSYFKFKKVLVVSPRDLTIIGRLYRVSDREFYLMAKTFNLASLPPTKNIVRADTLISGWHVKIIENGVNGGKPLCKCTFYSEVDFKISLFI